MHGKGSGAVNRVELECQVLCYALRHSWVRQDKVGAFTSIRELSHLFPDLLPPPEERNGSNKANYYETLTVRPQAGLNSIVVGYLKTVRKFLKEYNPKDYRQFYNTVLNAGFVLRKPRLRLSHDLVVARRWLSESQLEEDKIGPSEEEQPASLETAPTPDKPEPAQKEASRELSPAAPLAAEPSSIPADINQEVTKTPAEEDDPLDMIQKSWELKSTGEQQKETIAKASEQVSEAPESPQAVPEPTPVHHVEPTPPVQAPAAQESSPQTSPAVASNEQHEPAQGEQPKSFQFDENQLRKPEAEIDLPTIIKLMEHARLITNIEVQALKAQVQLAPNIPAEQLVLNAGYATRQELNSLRLAQDLLSSGKITMAQFQVAMYDERTSGLRMAESLQVRGWLETEVKNPIEEFKKPGS